MYRLDNRFRKISASAIYNLTAIPRQEQQEEEQQQNQRHNN